MQANGRRDGSRASQNEGSSMTKPTGEFGLVIETTEKIRQMLGGMEQRVAGSVICHLFAMWFADQHPDDRDAIWRWWLEAAQGIIAANDKFRVAGNAEKISVPAYAREAEKRAYEIFMTAAIQFWLRESHLLGPR